MVLDGNGDPLGGDDGTTRKLNHGPKRTFGGRAHVYAMSTGNRSSGWLPLSSVRSADVLDSRVGWTAYDALTPSTGCP